MGAWARRCSAGCSQAGAVRPGEVAVVEAVPEPADRAGRALPRRRGGRRARAGRRRGHRGQARRRARRLPGLGAAGTERAPVDRRRRHASPPSRRPWAPASPVVRAMPNTPALVGVGAAAIAGGTPRRRRRPGLGRVILGAVGIGRAGARAAARRRHRAVGLGAGLRVPRGRGADRGGGPGRPARRRERRARGPDAAGRGHPAGPRATRAPRRCGPPSPPRAAPPPPACGCWRSRGVRAALRRRGGRGHRAVPRARDSSPRQPLSATSSHAAPTLPRHLGERGAFLGNVITRPRFLTPAEVAEHAPGVRP